MESFGKVMFKARDSWANIDIWSGPSTAVRTLKSKFQTVQRIPESKYAYIDRGVTETDDVNVGIKVETIASCAWDSKELIDRNPGMDRNFYR